MPVSFYDRLTAWRNEDEQTDGAVLHRASADEAYVLRILKIILWLLGLAACVVLAWQGAGESIIVTGIITLLPIAAWVLFGLSSWGLLLPISLIAALALEAALVLT
jgi:hypothetical protein